MRMPFRKVFDLSGVQTEAQAHREKLISAVAGFLGILLVSGVSHLMLSGSEAALVVASMGASSVLVFAVPHGALSQPWPVIGGNFLSAVVGITCARFVPGVVVSSAIAVGLAIWVMYELGCLHPPGGATALSAVIGGEQISGLGYSFALTPVLLNAVLIVGAGILLNLFFSWRRYPVGLTRQTSSPSAPSGKVITHDDFAFALKELGSFVDVTENDLAAIYELASSHAKGDQLSVEELVEADNLSGKGLALVREGQPEKSPTFQPQVEPQPNGKSRI